MANRNATAKIEPTVKIDKRVQREILNKRRKNTTNLGEAIDSLYGLREKRLALAKQVEELKGLEVEQRSIVLKLLGSNKLESARGLLAVATRTVKEFPRVVDWDSFGAFVLRNKALDLLQRRPSTEGCASRWEEGVEIPGVEKDTSVDISLRKAGAK